MTLQAEMEGGEAQRIERLLRQQALHQWRPGQRLPPIKTLARQLEAGQNNTLLAVQSLVRDGLLRSRPRRGTFVACCADADAESGLRVEPVAPGALASRRVALLTPWRRPQAFVQRGIDAAEQVLAAGGVRLVHAVRAKDRLPEEARDCDGLIFINPGPGSLTWPQRAVAVVIETGMSAPFAACTGYDFVGFDSDHAACLAGQHLRAAGCRQVCFLGCAFPAANGYERTSAARLEGLECGWGEPIPRAHQLHCAAYMSVSGAKAVGDYLKLRPRPDGVCAASDELAIGFVHGAAAHGLEAGRDYQLIGFDGQDDGRNLEPAPLTSIAAPMAVMSRLAAELLARRLFDPSCPPCRIFLPGRLLQGGTTRWPV